MGLEHIIDDGRTLDRSLRAFIASFCDEKQEITILMCDEMGLEKVVFSNRVEDLLFNPDMDDTKGMVLDLDILWFEPTGQGAFTVLLLEENH
jgi:hypothetical protein